MGDPVDIREANGGVSVTRAKQLDWERENNFDF
jgi:hypothetical protein